MAIHLDKPFIAQPRAGARRGRDTLCAHLVSNLPGRRGTDELVAFATSIGLRTSWLQEKGTHREHFDLIGPGPIERARLAGAVHMTSREFGGIMRAKRRALTTELAEVVALLDAG